MSEAVFNTDEGSTPASQLTPEDAFPSLGNDCFLTVVAHLALGELACALRVCKAWQTLLDGTDRLWLTMCERTWMDKVYVPKALKVMAEGELAVLRAEAEARQDLLSLKIRELRERMRVLKMRSSGAHLLEKEDFADAILSATRKTAEEGSLAQKVLHRPSLCVLPNESNPKAALRLSLQDARRTAISELELQAFTFTLRCRNDGPLQAGLAFDPWWLGKGRGEARFQPDGRLTFCWPNDPEEPDKSLNPFAALGMDDEMELSWSLEPGGRLVQIYFHGQSGPQEIVCRHPITWGWVLYSQGTCWTSWEMPLCHEGVRCSDPLLQEEALRELPSGLEREY